MGFYLAQGSYTGSSAKAMIDAPQDRTAAVRSLIESLGGKLHHFFFSFGEYDFVALYEMPDDTAAAAIALAVAARDAISGYKTTKLFSTADAKAAMTKAKGLTYASPADTARR
jgi:uncharacterized protein with GYD domain